MFKNISPNPITLRAEYLSQNICIAWEESFNVCIPCPAKSNRVFRIWFSIPICIYSREKSIDYEWSHNDFIQEDNDEQDIDKVNTSPLHAKFVKDHKRKHKSSIARVFKYQEILNNICYDFYQIFIFYYFFGTSHTYIPKTTVLTIIASSQLVVQL